MTSPCAALSRPAPSGVLSPLRIPCFFRFLLPRVMLIVEPAFSFAFHRAYSLVTALLLLLVLPAASYPYLAKTSLLLNSSLLLDTVIWNQHFYTQLPQPVAFLATVTLSFDFCCTGSGRNQSNHCNFILSLSLFMSFR